MNDMQRVDDCRVLDGQPAAWQLDGALRPFFRPRRAANPAEPAHSDPMLEWIEDMRAGRPDALKKLYAYAAKPIRKRAFRITRDDVLAEEVMQITFLRAWTQAGRYDARRGSVLTWLSCMAQSASIDVLRNHNDSACVRAEAHAAAALEADSAANPEDQVADRQRAAQLHRALAKLDPLQRQLLGFAYFKGATHEEIADRLGLPLGTVKSSIKRALAKLRRALPDPATDDRPKCLERRGRNDPGRQAGSAKPDRSTGMR